MHEGKWSLDTVNIRDYALDKYGSVDDTPCGGGAGMIMRADVLGRAIKAEYKGGRIIYMSPRGKPLTQSKVRELSKEDTLTIVCGRFEGIDENTPFYINETGNPVVVFEAYEIAPGSEGTQEFEITQPAAAQVASASTKLSDVTALVGMKDEDTENLLGGGTENWTYLR